MAVASRSGLAAGRDQRVDALRALALVITVVAYCAPGRDHRLVLEVVRFLPVPLFGVLMGVSAQLGDRGARGIVTAFVRAGLRAVVLAALGLWLGSLGAPVDVALMYLALPTVLAPLLARLPSRTLGVLTLACWIASPVMQHQMAPHVRQALERHDDLGVHLWQVTFVGEHYRLLELLVFVCSGILVQRWCLDASGRSRRVVWGIAAWAVAGLLFTARASGRMPFEVSSGTRPEIAFGALCAVGVVLIWMCSVPATFPFGPVPAAGGMTLSIYTLQVVYLAWYVHDYAPGHSVDTWPNVAILCVGSLLLPLGWRSVVTARPWSRGPIEGPTALVTGVFDERR